MTRGAMPTAISSPWIVCHRPNSQASGRLFCFPFACGAALTYRMWGSDLPPEVEVCAIQLPGRESRIREAPFANAKPLVQALSSAILPYLDKPFAFFGHSMGALIAFELTRELRRGQGLQPFCLFVSSRYAPHLNQPDPPMHNLPDDEFISRLREYGGTPEEILNNAEIMSLLMPTLRADFSVNETYTYLDERPLDCPISAFAGVHDRIPHHMIEEWKAHTVSEFSLRIYPGDHFYLISSRNRLLRALYQNLMRYMSRIEGLRV